MDRSSKHNCIRDSFTFTHVVLSIINTAASITKKLGVFFLGNGKTSTFAAATEGRGAVNHVCLSALQHLKSLLLLREHIPQPGVIEPPG
jgi:hypothetical protein